MGEKNPERRLSAGEALKHKLFTKLFKGDVEVEKNLLQLPARLMKGFGRASKLERASLVVIAAQLSHEAIADLEQAFINMDKNGDGTLSKEELAEGFRQGGVHVDQRDLKEIIKKIDVNGSGAIDYSEFIAAAMDQSRYMRENTIWKAFKILDTDGSGYIDR